MTARALLRSAPVLVSVLVALAGAARGQKAPPGPKVGRAAPLAVFRIEPLGLDAERALRLEMLFRLELERLARTPLPSRLAVERAVARDPRLRACTGELECLTAIGRKLKVKHVVSGNVGEMGDSYVINLKLVDAEAGTEVRRISQPLRGSPDELIEEVRVAAYLLASPERLYGSIDVLSDVGGAKVFLDGKAVGTTPLTKPIDGLALGPHKLRITAPGYTDFFSEVDVRFQKTTQVVVRMVVARDPGGKAVPVMPGPARPAPTPWYSSNWAYVGFGAGAVLVGALVGLALLPDGAVQCDEDPAACGLR